MGNGSTEARRARADQASPIHQARSQTGRDEKAAAVWSGPPVPPRSHARAAVLVPAGAKISQRKPSGSLCFPPQRNHHNWRCELACDHLLSQTRRDMSHARAPHRVVGAASLPGWRLLPFVLGVDRRCAWMNTPCLWRRHLEPVVYLLIDIVVIPVQLLSLQRRIRARASRSSQGVVLQRTDASQPRSQSSPEPPLERRESRACASHLVVGSASGPGCRLPTVRAWGSIRNRWRGQLGPVMHCLAPRAPIGFACFHAGLVEVGVDCAQTSGSKAIFNRKELLSAKRQVTYYSRKNHSRK